MKHANQFSSKWSFRRGAIITALLVIGSIIVIGWLPRTASERPNPLQKHIGQLLSELGTITAAEGLIALESPLINTTEKDSAVFASRDGKYAHYSRAGYDLLAPTVVDRKTVLTTVRKRARLGPNIPDSDDKYSIESCDIDTRQCFELVSSADFHAVVGKRRIENIRLFRRQSDLIVVVVLLPISLKGEYTVYSVFRKVDGEKLKFLKNIDGTSFGPYKVSIFNSAIIFNGVILAKGDNETKNQICTKSDYCMFAYDVDKREYISAEKLTGFSEIPIETMERTIPDNGIFYSRYYFRKENYAFIKKNVYKKYATFIYCDPSCLEVIRLERGYYFGPIFENSGKLSYSRISENGDFAVREFDEKWREVDVINSIFLGKIENVELILVK